MNTDRHMDVRVRIVQSENPVLYERLLAAIAGSGSTRAAAAAVRRLSELGAIYEATVLRSASAAGAAIAQPLQEPVHPVPALGQPQIPGQGHAPTLAVAPTSIPAPAPARLATVAAPAPAAGDQPTPRVVLAGRD